MAEASHTRSKDFAQIQLASDKSRHDLDFLTNSARK
jgi:hypothetical protein